MALLEPLDEFQAMRRRMMWFFEPWKFGWPKFGIEKCMRPAIVDVEEKGSEIIVTAELPGMDKKDVKVDVTVDSILIKAGKKEEKEEKKKNYYYKERRYGGFYRSMSLPAKINPKSVKAMYKDGVLEIRMKKTATTRKKRTEVQIK